MLDTKSDLMIFSPKGTVGFDKRLNINAELRLTPQLSARLSRRIPGISLLKGDDGWTTLPFLISGTTENPSIGLDQKVLGGRLKDSTKDILQNLLHFSFFTQPLIKFADNKSIIINSFS